jgi:hypothetical protein
MIRPLVIAHDFLMLNSSGGQVERPFWENMADKHHYSPTIFCSDKGSKDLMCSYIDFKLIHEIRFIKYAAAIVRRILPDLTFLPDYEYVSWGRRAAHVAIKIAEQERFDYIHSISFPSSDHWCALKIKKASGLPWIAQFHDPWYDNPFRRFKTKCLKKKDMEMEKQVVENADIIIHNNDAIKELWRQRYGEDIVKKIVVIPLNVGFKSEHVVVNPRKIEGKLTITHIGNFYYMRKSAEFIKAVSVFVNQYPDMADKVQVFYLGNIMDEDKNLISKLHLTNIFHLLGKVPEEICYDYYRNSDVFLATAGLFNENIFFPSKILKYFYYQKPIFGITPKGTVLYHELKKSGHESFEINDESGMVNYLYRAVSDYPSLYVFNKDYWKFFSIDSVLDAYTRTVDKLLAK